MLVLVVFFVVDHLCKEFLVMADSKVGEGSELLGSSFSETLIKSWILILSPQWWIGMSTVL